MPLVDSTRFESHAINLAQAFRNEGHRHRQPIDIQRNRQFIISNIRYTLKISRLIIHLAEGLNAVVAFIAQAQLGGFNATHREISAALTPLIPTETTDDTGPVQTPVSLV